MVDQFDQIASSQFVHDIGECAMPKIVLLAARIPVLLACAVAALLVVAVGAATAQVAPAQGPFLRQAQAAGLTTTETAALQAQVDAYRAKVGGVQTAANKIEVGNGATLLLTLPGEVAARELDRRLPPQQSCSYQHLCLWQYANYSGDSYTLSDCDSWQIIPWLTLGSYRNDQTPGTKLGMRYTNGVQEFWTPAYTACSSGVHWENITYVTAC